MNIIIHLCLYIKIILKKFKFIFYKWDNLFYYNIIFVYYTILLIWLLEWLLIFNYFFNEIDRQNIIFSNGITFMLLIILLYWFFIWGLSVWRRSHYGKFTRGERILWAKAYAAFWIAEIVTLISFILIYCWLSWGSEILITRIFYMPRHGLLVEIICYTYLLIVLYIAKYTLFWGSWKMQFNLSLIILLLLGYLIWHNICFLLTREVIDNNHGVHWNNIKLNILVYNISHEWWVAHSLGHRSPYSKYGDLIMYLNLNDIPFNKFSDTTEYESNIFLNNINNFEYLFILKYNSDLTYYTNLFINYSLFYSRRNGFIPKRLTFWEFLTYLKIWHQLVILLWFLLYFVKLKNTLNGSYQFIAICNFNIYCCYLISFIIMLINYFTLVEIVLYLKYDVYFVERFLIFFFKWLYYIMQFIIFCTFENNVTLNIYYLIGQVRGSSFITLFLGTFILIIFFYYVTLLYAYLFSRRSQNILFREFYECGFKSSSDLRINIDVQFSIICLIFLIYDIEIIIIVPIIINILNLTYISYLLIWLVIIILIWSYFYEWEKYVLQWSFN